jgi:hypothetical protein
MQWFACLLPRPCFAAHSRGAARRQAQTVTVTGRVVDSTAQQPLAYVTVRVEGTQLAALSAPTAAHYGGVSPRALPQRVAPRARRLTARARCT